MSYLNMEQLLVGIPVRMRYAFRWSATRHGQRENVAEHSWFVTFYTMLICNHLDFTLADTFLALQKAIVHDLEEARSGDVNRIFKNSTPHLRSALNDAAVYAFDQTLEHVVDCDTLRYYKCVWRDSKTQHHGLVVKFADFLAVVAFLLEEKDVTAEAITPLEDYFYEFRKPDYDFLSELVAQVEPLVNQILTERTGVGLRKPNPESPQHRSGDDRHPAATLRD